MSRKMVSAMQVSLDGLVRGTDDTIDWVESWSDALQLIPDVDAFVQGAGMHPDYGAYWTAILADPKANVPGGDRPPTKNEIAYAKLAVKSPHYVLSRTLESVAWPPTATMVRDLDALRALKKQPGKNIYVVGGPTFMGMLLDAGLIDELKLIVHPLVLGAGRPLFGGVKRHALELVSAEPAQAGLLVLTYRA